MGLNLIENMKLQRNSALNDKEFNLKKIVLDSSPCVFFIQAAGPCNSNCLFCSRPKEYEWFNLEEHRRRFEDKLYPYISKSDTLVFTGSGEFLLLPQAAEIIDFFDKRFPGTEKQFSTNGSPLRKEICRKITSGNGKYTVHISLHASNPRLHQLLTRSDHFKQVIEQLEYLIKIRRKDKLELRLIFVATTLNIDDLPDFVRLAHRLGADRVICYYNYIYLPAQKYLSCFFKQGLTNRFLDEAKALANDLNMPLDLPPKFGLKDYPSKSICREPWSQLMTDSSGRVLPCDASEDCSLNIEKAASFKDDIWNSRYYQDLRSALIKKEASCFKHCFRANPAAVNDFSSHVIHRGVKEEIDLSWGDKP